MNNDALQYLSTVTEQPLGFFLTMLNSFTMSMISFPINLFYAIISIFIIFFIIIIMDKKFLKNIDIVEELLKGNMAVALVVSFTILSAAVVIAFSMR